MLIVIGIGVALTIMLFALVLCHAAKEGDRLADEMYRQWVMDSGYEREKDDPKASL